MIFDNSNYYEVLNVSHDATLDEINKAKDKLKFDPDFRLPFSQWGLIDEAYSALSNPVTRIEYDNFLNKNLDNLDSKTNLKETNFENQISISPKLHGIKNAKLKRTKGADIVGVKFQELDEFTRYDERLNKEIKDALLEPYNNYKLISKIGKYKLAKEMLEKQLELMKSRRLKNKISAFYNRLQILFAMNALKLTESSIKTYIIEPDNNIVHKK